MKWSFLIGIILAATWVAGCTGRPKPSLLDRNWGRSVETQKYTQMLNPHAGSNLAPVLGIEGEASANIRDKHIKSYETPAPQPVYNINIGGLGGSGKK